MNEVRVGPAGWSYRDWAGVVYERGDRRHPLRVLAQSFDCVEINSSFYATPERGAAERWSELVRDSERFRFVAKLNQIFTHGPPLSLEELGRERDAFLRSLAPLGDRLAGILVQFPVAFRAGAPSFDRLEALAEAFTGTPLVLEVRHRSWSLPDPLARIERAGFSLAAIDLPAAADHLPEDAPTPGPIGYLRLHGRNAASWFDRAAGRDQRYDYLYGPDEIEGIVERARRLAGEKDATYVVTNNHFSGKAVANAIDILHALTGASIDAPPGLVRRYPHLAPITRVRGQRSLF